MDNTTTLDGILNRRVMLEQPAQGYRVAMDTVFLAAAVQAAAGDRILDIGCGVGAAMLGVACRVRGITGLGIDIQPDLIELCRRNITRNIFAAGLSAREADITNLPPDLHHTFDHVLMNPPYHDKAQHDVSANPIKRIANSEKTGDLAVWIAAAADALKPSGSLTLIHRADRRHEILSTMRGAFDEIEILPLLPKPNTEPKRIIFRARKNALHSVRECKPVILHKAEGGYTEIADAVLRHCKAL